MQNEVSNKPLRKYDLPSCSPIPDLQFDINRLRSELEKLEDNFVSVYQSNKSFCSNNHSLAEKVYSHFEQVSLTIFDEEAITPNAQECHSLGNNPSQDKKVMSKHQKYRYKLSNDIRADLNEKNYTKSTELYKNTYLEECVKSFKAPATRVRLVKLNPGQVLPAHIDYDPSYSIRVLVPIVTNDRCINMVWRRGKQESYYIPSNGKPYFLNVGFSHGVANFGDQERVTLMISLNGQEDIKKLALNP